jgi:hypothetical protein
MAPAWQRRVSVVGGSAIYIATDPAARLCGSIGFGNARISWLVCSMELVLALQTELLLVMDEVPRIVSPMPRTPATSNPPGREAGRSRFVYDAAVASDGVDESKQSQEARNTRVGRIAAQLRFYTVDTD